MLEFFYHTKPLVETGLNQMKFLQIRLLINLLPFHQVHQIQARVGLRLAQIQPMHRTFLPLQRNQMNF